MSSAHPTRVSTRRAAWLLAASLLGGCAGGPPPPDWQANAHAALERATAAYLNGDDRAEAQASDEARREIARTGRADLLARAELMRCAARVASVVFEPCAGFERLRGDAAAPERAYAAHLAAQPLPADQIALLPAAQQAAARALANPGAHSAPAAVTAIADPQARLIAIGVLFQAGQASPALLQLALDTASAQGWRRALRGWLEVMALRAERAGDMPEAQRLRRRLQLVQEGAPGR